MQFVSTAAHGKQSLYLFKLPFCDVEKNFFNFTYQLQEEAGSAEEQPASNKADTYTVNKGSHQWLLLPFYLPVSYMAQKKLIRNLRFMLLLLFDTLHPLIILHAICVIIFGQCE